MMQAAAITIEDFVIDTGKKIGLRDSSLIRFVGYMWTITFILYTNVALVAPSLEYGVGTTRVFKRSAVWPALEYLRHTTGFDNLHWIAEKCAV